MEKLNAEQRSAVEETEGYVRVVAGAGSGKTRVLTTRYVYIAKVLGISPENILSVTFTNKAAREMQQRIQKYMPDENGGWILTFHGACHRMLKEDINHLSFPSNFMIMDEDDQEKLLAKIYSEYNFTVRDFTYKRCLDAIGNYKCRTDYVPYLTNPVFEGEPPELPSNPNLSFIIKQYLIEQRKNYYLDFDDLIFFMLHLLETNEEVCRKWQEKFEYIQVDEFQDVSAPEFELVEILSDYHKNLFIVGDPDQTIYTWRGAKVDFFVNFDTAFENVKTIILDKNYRSTPEILAVANSLIKFNKNRIEKSLQAVNASGPMVRYHHSKSVEDESKWIAEEIDGLRKRGVDLKDIAVLFRGNYMTRSIEEAFIKKKIRYRIYNGVEFYRRQEIKDVLAYLRMLVFGDDLSFLRIVNVPSRGIGRKRITALTTYAKENNVSLYSALRELVSDPLFTATGAVSFISAIEQTKEHIGKKNVNDLIDIVLKKSGYEEMLMVSGDQERINNVNELKNAVKAYVDSAGEEVTPEEYLNAVALISNADSEERADSVKLMTIHTAKGLEFPYVFVCCLNEGKFPSRKIKNKEDMEEERRVAYVAFTRAEKELYLSDAEGFNPQSAGEMYTSRFIFNIWENKLMVSGEISEDFIKLSQAYIADEEGIMDGVAEADNFAVGDNVTHKVFGSGRVIAIAPSGIKVTFENGSTRTFAFARADSLTKI